MIKTDASYQKAIEKLKDDQNFIAAEKERLKHMGLTHEQIEIAIEPTLSFHEQLKDEVVYYEKIKRGDFGKLINFEHLGKTLIAYRIFVGMSQQELAAKLGVSEAQVSRDERNEYYGATKERIEAVMNAMNMVTVTTVEISMASVM
ncbi:helix-turn-helix domain-containing protein [Paenibacillus athensensis]|uniref:Transcriptional regulator n=1 Tax=Paenibacillus athensensis TaxID=1967502 RepID=A0A4Y8QA06_9BACL|nr:helix-turn-helix transcriptional regulator [Paenibacillus athensensis]MCD1258943.1 helix-turn-helix domain-containing protein [Paenibacillus athensensis]